MRLTQSTTGPRFPALRVLTFLLRVGAAGAFVGGAWGVAGVVRAAGGFDRLLAPEQRDLLVAAATRLGAGVLAALLLLAVAELISLFIHLERNTRALAAAFAPAPLPEDDVAPEAPLIAEPQPQPRRGVDPRGSRLPWLEADEPADGLRLQA